RRTGQGCHVDSSQVEAGTYLTGTAVLDFSVNGRSWQRYGNRSPYKLAAPHGAFPCAGDDRWIAISCFTDEEWRSLTTVLGTPDWADDPRFSSLPNRLANQDALEELVTSATRHLSPFDLMEALQIARVPAGVCQTAEDRYEHDPQLRHLEWLVEL